MTDATFLAPPSVGTVFRLAWPLTTKAVMLHGVVVVDALLVAPLGETALAAMGLAAAIGGLLMGVVVAFSNAAQIRAAQAFGSGEPLALKTAMGCAGVVNLATVTLGILAIALFGGAVLLAAAPSPAIAAEAHRYLMVFAVAAFAEAVAECFSGYFNGCGRTKVPFASYLLAIPVNVGVSVVFIHGLAGMPELGVTGAAVGTATGSLLRAAFLAWRFNDATRWFRDVPGWSRGSLAAALRRHLAFSLPIAATFVSATTAASVCTLIYARLPIHEFAALTLILPWVHVAGTLGMSWAQAVGILVAQLLGRDAPGPLLDRFLLGAWRAAFAAAALVALIYLAVCLVSDRLYDDLERETRATLLAFLPVLLLLPFPKGSNAMCGHTLRAGGETVWVMHIFVWSQWLFRVPATAVMVLWLEMPAPWIFSLVLAEELVKLAPFHLRLLQGGWKRGRAEI
ncbi:MATE family efflux transporter [Jannaschia sp. W003]|uniref:MATE family efflux transporter n=1 Tax=Jannaschia sp. W003 TaxID=2867012 RepID=UPI0021A918A4|nr:MATE family efflux transporter [Jannaschia sp. W003]UWQ23198.1 polysaccharide biosynthesis C-terminal domain-containing protein [Jannaschia sp. W003]